jgi:hypothetical protein
MNTVSSLKLVSFLSRLALVSVAAFTLGVVLNVQPLALFSFAIGALTLLVVAGDYAPRDRDRASSPVRVLEFTPAPNRAPTAEMLAA